MTKSKWQAKARRQVGLPKNYSTSKTTESQIPNEITRLRHVIFSRALISVGIGTGINQRLRDSIYVAGIKIDAHFNLTHTGPCFVNWAVVSARANVAGNTINANTPDFFRDYTDERAWNADAANKTGISWANATINTDRFTVLKRGKFLLTPDGNDYKYGSGQKTMSCYVKLGRMFTFDDAIGGCEDQVHFVTWWADPNGGSFFNQFAGGTERLRAIMYYRDPKTS
jgi:hypothetical protein